MVLREANVPRFGGVRCISGGPLDRMPPSPTLDTPNTPGIYTVTYNGYNVIIEMQQKQILSEAYQEVVDEYLSEIGVEDAIV